MSLYHLSRAVIKRSAGNSACKALSYIHRTKIRDEYLNKTYSFHSKEGEIVESKLHLPDATPASIRALLNKSNSGGNVFSAFAQLIEGAENEVIDSRCKTEATRENMKSRMQTGFMEVVALQKELTLEQNRKILDQYIEETYISRNLMVSSAVHFEEDNPHAHLFVGLRSISKEGFSPIKEREVMTRASLKNCREAWARIKMSISRLWDSKIVLVIKAFSLLELICCRRFMRVMLDIQHFLKVSLKPIRQRMKL